MWFCSLWDPYMPIWDDVVGCDMWFCMLYFGNATAEWKPCFLTIWLMPLRTATFNQRDWPQSAPISGWKPGCSHENRNLCTFWCVLTVRGGDCSAENGAAGSFRCYHDLPWFTFTGRNQIVQNTSECWFHRRWINTIIHGSGNNSWEVRFECNARSARKSYKETGWIRLNQANQPSERDNIMQMVRVNHFIFNL